MRIALAVIALAVALGSAACGDVASAPSAVPTTTATPKQADNIVWGS